MDVWTGMGKQNYSSGPATEYEMKQYFITHSTLVHNLSTLQCVFHSMTQKGQTLSTGQRTIL